MLSGIIKSREKVSILNTMILDGIQKKAVLDMLIPGGYGYYAHSRGKKLSDTALKGALLGGGVETVSSLGDILSGDVDLNTLTSPVKGALVGGVSAIGGQTILPLLISKAKHVDWSEASKRAVERAKTLLDRLGEMTA